MAPPGRASSALLLGLPGDCLNVLFQPGLLHVVTLVLVRDLPACRDVVDRLAGFEGVLHVRDEDLVELRVFAEVCPRYDRSVSGDYRIDVLYPIVRLGQRFADLYSTPAVVRVEYRKVVARDVVSVVPV